MRPIHIVGAGGHGAVVAEVADLLGFEIAGFIDDDPGLMGQSVLGWKVLGGREKLCADAAVVMGIGDNPARAKLLAEAMTAGWELPVLIHPSAVISPSAELGPGTVVMAQVAVNARVRIGRACILNTSCSVDHDCTIGDAAHVAPGARLAANVSIGERALVGIGSCVKPGIKIGAGCLIGAGSVVVNDIPAGTRAFGNPARVRTMAADRAAVEGGGSCRTPRQQESER